MEVKKYTRKYLNSSIGYVVLGILFALGTNHGLAFALSTDMPIVAVESNSMVPTFQRGDILVLQGIPSEHLTVGDIIVFSPNTQTTPIVHRIIDINPDGTFQTKGDANTGQLSFEKKIDENQIHGREVLIIPYLGWIKIGVIEYLAPNILWVIFISAIGIIAYVGTKNFIL